MSKSIIIDRLLLLAIAFSTMGVLAVGAYGIYQENADIREMEKARVSDTKEP